jgi:hypothetical protein
MGITGRVNIAYYWSKGDVRFVYLGKSIEVTWFTVLRSQFMLQGIEKVSFVFGKKFPYLPRNLRRDSLT